LSNVCVSGKRFALVLATTAPPITEVKSECDRDRPAKVPGGVICCYEQVVYQSQLRHISKRHDRHEYLFNIWPLSWRQ
jgi:hypothetical protein